MTEEFWKIQDRNILLERVSTYFENDRDKYIAVFQALEDTLTKPLTFRLMVSPVLLMTIGVVLCWWYSYNWILGMVLGAIFGFDATPLDIFLKWVFLPIGRKKMFLFYCTGIDLKHFRVHEFYSFLCRYETMKSISLRLIDQEVEKARERPRRTPRFLSIVVLYRYVDYLTNPPCLQCEGCYE